MAKNRRTVKKRLTRATKGRRTKRVGGVNPEYNNFEPGSGEKVYNLLFNSCIIDLSKVGLSNTDRWGNPVLQAQIKDNIVNDGKTQGDADVDSAKNDINAIADKYKKYFNNLEYHLTDKFHGTAENETWENITRICATKAYWDNFDEKIRNKVWNIILPWYLTEIDKIYDEEAMDMIIKGADLKKNKLGAAASKLRGIVNTSYNTTNVLNRLGAVPVGGKYKRTRRNKRKGARRNKRKGTRRNKRN